MHELIVRCTSGAASLDFLSTLPGRSKPRSGIWRASTVEHTKPARPDDGLSERELQVLELVAQGRSNKLIARELGLSPHTVKRHMARIFNKTGQSSRGQVAAWHRTEIRRGVSRQQAISL